MKKLFGILALIIMISTSCEKRDNDIVNSNENLNLKSGEVPVDSLGIVHNNGLDYILSRYSVDSVSNDVQEVFRIIDSLQLEYYESIEYQSQSLNDDLMDLALATDKQSWLNTYFNSGVSRMSLEYKNYLINILDFIDTKDFTRIELHKFLNKTYQLASSNLNTTEIKKLEGDIVVAKSSFDYWFNSDGTPRNNVKAPINWWRTFGADCIGAIGGPQGYLAASALDVYYQYVVED